LARWNSSTSTTRPYLKELRNRDPGDAVTDAATALQKNKGLLKGNDTPLTDAVCKTSTGLPPSETRVKRTRVTLTST
jgi:ferric iron reductase protein FhuF